MTKRLRHILEVIELITDYIRREAQPISFDSVVKARRWAMKQVTERRGLTEHTVPDACTTQIGLNISQFDHLVFRHLVGIDHDLRQRLEAQCKGEEDRRSVARILGGESQVPSEELPAPPPSEVQLALEAAIKSLKYLRSLLTDKTVAALESNDFATGRSLLEKAEDLQNIHDRLSKWQLD